MRKQQKRCRRNHRSGILTGTGVSKDSYKNLPGYTAADSGKGYAMKKMGKVKDYNDIMSKCLIDVYMQITPAFCQSSSSPGYWFVALYDNKGNDKMIGCPQTQSGCTHHDCPDVLYGACVIKDSYAILPGYKAAASGKGYAMTKMGTVKDPKEIMSKCLDAVYQQITPAFCQNSSNPGQWYVVLYDDYGNIKAKNCAQSGCDYHACPVVQYGACVIRNHSVPLPGYNAADSGSGYAMTKMGTVKDYNEIKSKCLDAVYQQITPAFCQNSSTPGQWIAALSDDKGNYKTTGCAQSGCNYHACPVNK